MKRKMRIVAALAVLTFACACDPYGKEIEYLKGEADSISEEFEEVNLSVKTLTDIMVAMQGNDFITSVEAISDGDGRVGYDFVFSKSGRITLWCGIDGEDGKDGRDGTDGVTPEISIRQDSDGIWYWTVNGKWLWNSDYKKVPVAGSNGILPLLEIREEYWYVSYDNGNNWERVGSSVAGETNLFKSVDFESSEYYVTLVLKDNTTIKIPKGSPLNLSLYNYSSNTINAGETITLNYSVSGTSSAAKLSSFEPKGWEVVINSTNGNQGTITIKAPDVLVFQTILIFANSDGYTTMTTIDLSPASENLSINGTANCYIVSKAGRYKFDASVMGCSYEKIENTDNGLIVSVLWESSGSDQKLFPGTLVKDISLTNSNDCWYINFSTSEVFHEGNAVIALKNATGNILWSWHIWFTEYEPEKDAEMYSGHTGVPVMSRNLGAISDNAGDVGTMGLFYQWGRKDPFPGSSSYLTPSVCETSVSWPEPKGVSDKAVEYSVSAPMTFLTAPDESSDWSGSSEELWSSSKTKYDPCPSGWRIPDGGEKGLWSGFPSGKVSGLFDSSRYGFMFGRSYSAPDAWYPASGRLSPADGKLESVGTGSFVWSCTGAGTKAYGMFAQSDNTVNRCSQSGKAAGYNIRCVKDAGMSSFPEGEDKDLSAEETANCYIVPSGGSYKFKAITKGNSAERLNGTPVSASVVWETFGNDDMPESGSIVSSVSYKDGYVHLKMADPYRQGSALVAVSDASGKILWNWHIWACPFNPQATKAMASNGTYVMDRNLGAQSSQSADARSLGLKYQWGRKEPFPGFAAIVHNRKAAITGTWTTISDYNIPNLYYTEDYSTANPTAYINAQIVRTIPDYLLWEFDKNKHDPCPPGWRVMDFPITDSYYSGLFWDNNGRGVRAGSLWFPASGGQGRTVGISGDYLMVSNNSWNDTYQLTFNSRIENPLRNYYSNEYSVWEGSVRCIEDNWSKELGGQAVDLGRKGRANCYMVSEAGLYKFNAGFKGNGIESIGGNTAELIWETDNTSASVNKGELISWVKYHNGYIYFSTAEKFKEGNALIALTYGGSTVSWSWHIWLTKYDPSSENEAYVQHRSYPVMDRNLGALSDKPGNPLANGLLYQWGRKDPFPGSASSSGNDLMAVAGQSMKVISSTQNANNANTNPFVFYKGNSTDGSWILGSFDTGLWASAKTYNDPCPSGWRVPESGEHNLWSGFPSSSSYLWDSSNKGLNLGKQYSQPSSWYPATGYLDGNTGNLVCGGESGGSWSCVYGKSAPYSLDFDKDGIRNSDTGKGAACGRTVRCCKDWGNEVPPLMDFYFPIKEYTIYVDRQKKISCKPYPSNSVLSSLTWTSSDTKIASVNSDGAVTGLKEGKCVISASCDGLVASCSLTVEAKPSSIDLSSKGSANCYIAQPNDNYKFKALIGNSDTSVGTVSKVEVLWSSLGTSVTPESGDIIASVGYSSPYIEFSTGQKEGNAVVAAKDSQGKILWSWHIWVTEYDPSQDYDTYLSGAVFMNRNLGAISNTFTKTADVNLTYGLSYQWGRKDPFPGRGTRASSSFAATLPSDAIYVVNSDQQKGTIDYSIRKPSAFITRNAEDWLYNGGGTSRWADKKTIYDPCPAGWKVPEIDAWVNINSSGAYRTYKTGGFFFKTYSSPETWYPFTGYIHPDGYWVNSNGTGNIWSASTCGDDSYSFEFGNNWISYPAPCNRADGRSIRCVLDN